MSDETKDTPENHDEKPKEVGADVPEKAQPLPPEAGAVDPAAEVEAKVKSEAAPSEELKTEAKAENALPGVEKPSKTPEVEGASAEGEGPAAPKAAPKEAVTAKPAPPRAPATEKPAAEKAAPPKAAPAAGHKIGRAHV